MPSFPSRKNFFKSTTSSSSNNNSDHGKNAVNINADTVTSSAPVSRLASTVSDLDINSRTTEPNNRNGNVQLQKDFSEKWESQRIDFAKRCLIPVNNAHQKQNCCETIDGTNFNVRCGPNYRKNKQKAPSCKTLYELVAVRCFKSNKRSHHVTKMLPLPDELLTSSETAAAAASLAFPQVLVVHFCLPYETPNMFKPKTDGTGAEVILYLRPSQALLSSSSNNNDSAAKKLFQSFYETCTTTPTMRHRFKCMALVQNLSSLSKTLSWLNQYNGKPCLITESGSAYKGTLNTDATTTAGSLTYLELSVNVHQWAFLSKKSFVGLLPKFKDMLIDVGFTVEALSDDEMPECILGCAGVRFIEEHQWINIPEELQC